MFITLKQDAAQLVAQAVLELMFRVILPNVSSPTRTMGLSTVVALEELCVKRGTILQLERCIHVCLVDQLVVQFVTLATLKGAFLASMEVFMIYQHILANVLNKRKGTAND